MTTKKPKRGPGHALKALGVDPDDLLELEESADGFVLRPRRLDPSLLAPLRAKIRPDVGAFDVGACRRQPYDPSLRD